jgi:hypothetical protein
MERVERQRFSVVAKKALNKVRRAVNVDIDSKNLERKDGPGQVPLTCRSLAGVYIVRAMKLAWRIHILTLVYHHSDEMPHGRDLLRCN